MCFDFFFYFICVCVKNLFSGKNFLLFYFSVEKNKKFDEEKISIFQLIFGIKKIFFRLCISNMFF